jgi:hypothetical protein
VLKQLNLKRHGHSLKKSVASRVDLCQRRMPDTTPSEVHH